MMYQKLKKTNYTLTEFDLFDQGPVEIIHSHMTTAEDMLGNARKANILGSVIVSFVGFIGHFLIILVFSQKKFRTNSCNVYLLCLALNDSMFLIIHVIIIEYIYLRNLF